MRARSGLFVVVAAMVLLASACGSAEPTPDLLQEYTRSTEVKNDKFPSDGGSPEDRLANFAAYYTPDQLQTALLSATPCDPDADCALVGAARHAARDFAGADGEIFQRSVLVKHADSSLELVTLYVARRSDRSTALVDATGATYRGGLDDFRANNDLLGADDLIRAPRDITAVPGEGEIVTVTGHTPATWYWWLIGAAAAVLVLGAALVLLRRVRSLAAPRDR